MNNHPKKPSSSSRIFSAANGAIPDLGLLDHTPIAVPEIEDPRREKDRVAKRLLGLVGQHEISAERLGIKHSPEDFNSVFHALREHARKGIAPSFIARDEIHQYLLDSIFAELVEEPSNILYTTSTGPDTIRYDAMKPEFWCECLDFLESKICP